MKGMVLKREERKANEYLFGPILRWSRLTFSRFVKYHLHSGCMRSPCLQLINPVFLFVLKKVSSLQLNVDVRRANRLVRQHPVASVVTSDGFSNVEIDPTRP